MEKYTLRLCNTNKLDKYKNIETEFETDSIDYEDIQEVFQNIFLELRNLYFDEWYIPSGKIPYKNILQEYNKAFEDLALNKIGLDKWEYKINNQKEDEWYKYEQLTHEIIENLIYDESGFSLSSNDCSLLRKMFERYLLSGSWHIGYFIAGKYIEKKYLKAKVNSGIPTIWFSVDNEEPNKYFSINSTNISENIWLKSYNNDECNFFGYNLDIVFHEHLLLCELDWGPCESEVFELFTEVKNKCPISLNQTIEKIISDLNNFIR